MAQKSITKEEEVAKLNEAIETLRSFCKSHRCLEGCAFRKENQSRYGTLCKFGSFYPELWDDLKIKEEVYNESQS